MYKDREKQKAATKDRVRRYREKRKGVTPEEGVTNIKQMLEAKGVTEDIQDLLNKLTDPVWRPKLEKICQAFQNSHHPSYVNDVYLGNINLSVVCDLLEVTG